ncbi:unnamed protein product [Acanthosepion pharaonis]|uniref:Uncharacterized protein n=1 Tax=Acanthosepion pharaonis TaxID=158019 RepID=A0A812AVZ7_ACAPH|nr:unnamed protein product [Sepia pharaonis]
MTLLFLSCFAAFHLFFFHLTPVVSLGSSFHFYFHFHLDPVGCLSLSIFTWIQLAASLSLSNSLGSSWLHLSPFTWIHTILFFHSLSIPTLFFSLYFLPLTSNTFSYSPFIYLQHSFSLILPHNTFLSYSSHYSFFSLTLPITLFSLLLFPLLFFLSYSSHYSFFSLTLPITLFSLLLFPLLFFLSYSSHYSFFSLTLPITLFSLSLSHISFSLFLSCITVFLSHCTLFLSHILPVLLPCSAHVLSALFPPICFLF